jgi:hypothetical protein
LPLGSAKLSAPYIFGPLRLGCEPSDLLAQLLRFPVMLFNQYLGFLARFLENAAGRLNPDRGYLK